MKKYLLLILLQIFIVKAFALRAPIGLALKITDARLQNISGIMHVNNQIWVHSNKGGSSKLYLLGIKTDVLRTPIWHGLNKEVVSKADTAFVVDSTSFANIGNVDWEDLAFDSNYVYIGDIGNFFGDRKNLRVYRFPIDKLGSKNVYVDTISFSYAEQSDFATRINHDFDCEALSANDSLLILCTKGTGGKMYTYHLSKKPGTYRISRIASYDNPNSYSLTGLAAYIAAPQPWYYSISVNDTNQHQRHWAYGKVMRLNRDFKSLSGDIHNVPVYLSCIDYVHSNLILGDTLKQRGLLFTEISVSPASDSFPALLLMHGYTASSKKIDYSSFKMFPNPVSQPKTIHLDLNGLNPMGELIIKDFSGKIVLKKLSKNRNIELNIDHLSSGTYTVSYLPKGGSAITRKLIVE